jgi:hypothetical protein
MGVSDSASRPEGGLVPMGLSCATRTELLGSSGGGALKEVG